MWPEESEPRTEHGDPYYGALGPYWGAVVESGSTPGAIPTRAVFYVPDSGPDVPPRPGGPSHIFAYGDTPPGGCVGRDLRFLDRESEIEAFRVAYARELAEMAKAAG